MFLLVSYWDMTIIGHMKVLIVEDNEILARNLTRFLAGEDIHAKPVADGLLAFSDACSNYYDIILLDINLPGMDGLEFCEQYRKKAKNTPIIMLTSRSTKWDIVTGLNQWADDYLTKPFDYDELLARLHSLTRRNMKQKSTSELKAGEYIIDLEKMEVSHDDTQIKLSNLEFNLLKYFAQNHGRVIDRQELYEKVWGEFDWDFMFSKTVDVYIGYLRKKLGRELIETKKGAGYILK